MADPSDVLADASTLNLIAQTTEQRRRAPSLTVLYHPALSRIGEQARLVELLEGRPAGISRLEPLFRPPGSDDARPLADLFLSRRPVLLEPSGERLRIAAEGLDVLVDGERLSVPRTVGADELERGVVLELAQRVVVLVHMSGPLSPSLPALGLIGESTAIHQLRAKEEGLDLGRSKGG